LGISWVKVNEIAKETSRPHSNAELFLAKQFSALTKAGGRRFFGSWSPLLLPIQATTLSIPVFDYLASKLQVQAYQR
jgi:hypothetical protein